MSVDEHLNGQDDDSIEDIFRLEEAVHFRNAIFQEQCIFHVTQGNFSTFDVSCMV